MLIYSLIQDMQSCFKNPMRDVAHPSIKIITDLYKKYETTILTTPVTLTEGYGCATGINGTFKERVDRFVVLLRTNFDVLKKLYTVDMNQVVSMLFLYDIGIVNMSAEDRQLSEKDLGKTMICGQTVLLLRDAAIQQHLGHELDQTMIDISILYRRLSGDNETMKSSTEIALAAHLIQMDKIAIETIKDRINVGVK